MSDYKYIASKVIGENLLTNFEGAIWQSLGNQHINVNKERLRNMVMNTCHEVDWSADFELVEKEIRRQLRIN